MDRGDWWATNHRVAELDMTGWLAITMLITQGLSISYAKTVLYPESPLESSYFFPISAPSSSECDSVLTILLKIATPLFTLLHFFCFSIVPLYMYNYLFYLLFIHYLSLLEYKIREHRDLSVLSMAYPKHLGQCLVHSVLSKEFI